MGDERRRIKIAFVTPMDPQDKRAWSGILFHTAQALQKYCGDVSYIGQTTSNQKPGRKAFYKKMRFLVKKYSSYNLSSPLVGNILSAIIASIPLKNSQKL